jgi:hypothetical protein
MENKKTDIRSIIIIVVAWLMALAILYIVIIKMKILFKA